MKKVLGLSVFCVAAAVVLGCGGEGLVIRYINNTPDAIFLKDWKVDHRIEPGGSLIEGAGLLPDDFPIVIKTKQRQQLRFDIHGISRPPEFWADKKLNQVGMVLQFQDKKLYLLYPTNTTATTNIPVQPPGFPLLAVNPDQYWLGTNETNVVGSR